MSTSDSRLIHLSRNIKFSPWWRDLRRPLSISSDWELIVLHFYVWSQSLHPRPTVLTFEASYYIWGQLLLHLEPVNTFQVNCYYIWSQLLHLRPIITFVASTVRPSVRPSVNQPCVYLYFLQWDWELAQIPGGEQNAFISFVIWVKKVWVVSRQLVTIESSIVHISAIPHFT